MERKKRDEDEEVVVSMIKACLISVKGQLELRQLQRDYHTLAGEPIPVQKLGYRSLEEFVCKIPSLIVTRCPNGQILLDARPNPNTAHIAKLVSGQKTDKATKVRRMHHRVVQAVPIQSKWQPKHIAQKYRRPIERSPRVSQIVHKQFVQRSPLGPRLTRFSPPIPKLSPLIEKPPLVERATTPKSFRPQFQDASEAPSVGNLQEVGGITRKTQLVTLEKKPLVYSLDDSASWINNATPVKVVSKTHNAKIDLKEIEKKPTEIPQEVPSKEEVVNPAMFKVTGDYLKDLEEICQYYKLEAPMIKVIRRKTSRNIVYDCQIKIDKESFSSYPNDYLDELSSRKAVAKEAVNHLQAKHGRRKSLLVSSENDVMNRMLPIVKSHFYGIWNWQLEADYLENFNEQLPSNWLEVVDLIPCISVTPSSDKFILRYCHPDEVLQKNSLAPPISFDVSVPSNTVQFREDGFLVAEISCAVSAREIWCRQLNTPEMESYSAMSDKMQEFYTENNVSRPQNITVGGYYAIDCEMWLRVRVFEVLSDTVNCFCIDYGDEFEVPISDVRLLDRRFAKDQAQAFVCRLAGLEELYSQSESSKHLVELVGRVVQVENCTEETESTDPTLSVILYDPDTKEVINQNLITLISIESATPSLNPDGPTEVIVTGATTDGFLFLNVPTPGYKHLKQLLIDLGEQFEQNIPASVMITPERNQLYFIKNKKDSIWYRVQIMRKLSDDEVLVFAVDTGCSWTIVLSREVLCPLEELSDVIATFPYQALKVKMDIPQVPANFIDKIATLLPTEVPALLKITRKEGEDFLVELFKRSAPDGVLFSVNTAIMMENQLQQSQGDSNNNSSGPSMKLQRLMSLNQFDKIPSSGLLATPPIPAVNNYFDVRVPCAVNPWNFFVQPLVSKDDLQSMMQKMQEIYNHIPISPLQLDDISPGQIYASKHTDGNWYRTAVIKVIHAGSISVFYCDFGYYANLTSQQLMPLDREFMKLPYQAIKAKLFGIKPKMDKWTMDDCTFFQELVLRKPFVSVLRDTEKDVLYRCDTVLCLSLIDVSNEFDVQINKVLIDKGIAVRT